MNDLNQVVAQFMVQTKSWMEVESGLKLLYRRCELLAIENDGATMVSYASLASTSSLHQCRLSDISLIVIFCLTLQVPKYIYVDDANDASAARIKATFGQTVGVLLDATHMMRRYQRTCTENHPMTGESLCVHAGWWRSEPWSHLPVSLSERLFV